MASTRTPSGGVVSISDGAGSGVTVTINGCGTTVLTAGYGVILETTSTTHTYNFHRLSPSTLSITTVSDNISNINAVANNETNINAVNNNSTNINAVANNNSNITAVAGNATNINAVAPNVSNISAVNANATNINTVADNNSNINTVANAASNISTVATNISSVNNFADRYRVASSAPSSSLDVGDLYFDTTGNELKVYNGSAWQGGVTATGNLVSKSGDEFTGNITFSGSQTVDGRDLSVDGAKLDGIAASANNYAISSDLLDQDDMVSNSATKVPSQQSVKAYVDNQTLSLIDEDNMSTNSATRPPSQQSVKAYADTKAPKASPAFTGTATGVNLTLSGDLTVNGTTTTLNSTTVSIDDKNLELGKVATPTDTTADGGGITLKGGTDKTITWSNATNTWDFNQGIKIDGDLNLPGANYDLTWDKSANTLLFNDNTAAKFGTNGNLKIHYDGSDAYLESASDTLQFRVAGGNRLTINGSSGDVQFQGASGKNLNWDNSAGSLIFNDNAKAIFGTSSDGLEIFHDASNSRIKDTGTGALKLSGNVVAIENAGTTATMATFNDGASVDLYHNGTKKFETLSNGVAVAGKVDITGGHLYLDDNYAARFGNGEDLLIYHDSSNNHSFIKESGAGNLYIFSANLRIENADGSKSYMEGDDGGAASLYWAGSSAGVRLATSEAGVTVTGNLVASNVDITGEVLVDSGKFIRGVMHGHGDKIIGGYTSGSTTLRIGESATLTVGGLLTSTSVADSKGNLRSIPQNSQSSAYTLVAADAGKHIYYNSTGDLTVPVTGSDFSAGDAITIVNGHATGTFSIKPATGVTIWNSADGTSVASTGLTLGVKGMCTLLCVGTNGYYISGAGLS